MEEDLQEKRENPNYQSIRLLRSNHRAIVVTVELQALEDTLDALKALLLVSITYILHQCQLAKATSSMGLDLHMKTIVIHTMAVCQKRCGRNCPRG